MNRKGWVKSACNGFYSFTETMMWVGYVALAGIILIVFADVFGRYFLNKPLMGSFEIVELAMTVFGGFAILYATVKRGHVFIDLLVGRFPGRTRIIMGRTASLLGFGTWAVIAYRVYFHLMNVVRPNDTTPILNIPPRPFLFIFTVAALLSSVTLLMQTFGYDTPEAGAGKEKQEVQP